MIRTLLLAASALALTAAAPAHHRARSHRPVATDRGSARVDALLAKMTLDEKLGQVTQMPGGRSKALNSLITEEERVRIREGRVGSYLNVAGAEDSRALQRIAVEQSRLHIPLLFGLDVIHGYRTIFPVPLAMAASWDPSVPERAARLAAEEASASGVHWTFSPMVDIARDPRWGRIVEGAGEDPFLGSAMAAAQVRGYQGHSLAEPGTILATVKHFAGYGAGTGGRDYAEADMSERTLNEIYLPPFYAAAKAGAGSLMTAFESLDGVPMTANRALVRGTLRGAWGWPGLIVSDWKAVAELRNHGIAGSDEEAAALALDGGVDMDMSAGLYATALKAAVQRDPALRAELDQAVRRVLAAKEKLGLFDHPYRDDPDHQPGVFLSDASRAVAREAARRSIVLLKNDGNLLPIAASARRIAVIGGLADDPDSELGSWRAQGHVEDVAPLLPALREALPKGTQIDYQPGAGPRSDDRGGIGRAVEAARRADLVLLVVGEDFDMTGEARSRSDLGLPGAQQVLADAVLDTGKPVVVLLMNGRPLAIDRLAERAPAILETWFLGVEAGPAIADILTGRVSPGGKLPATFPRATGAVPFFYDRLPSGRPADPDPTKDTVRYHDLPITPLFPFGHGLSYARFDYSGFSVSRASVPADGEVNVSVTVRNASEVAGDEVVQLYVHDPVASVSRPIRELRGFRRIALAPGEAKRVSFTLSPAQMAIWDASRWKIEPGEIDLMVGSSSADIRARGSFRIANAGFGTEPAAAIPTPSQETPAP
ncbi:MAG TPA: glycoside hydrolase family 3 N-terminal domain-containing protein [Allosphingosinicella sp.]|jgi:beta-glucosidase|nr:glycoside hydrolase family 3 N-terminal domain-containing protein [Allosphingosinicella sp.]